MLQQAVCVPNTLEFLQEEIFCAIDDSRLWLNGLILKKQSNPLRQIVDVNPLSVPEHFDLRDGVNFP